MNQWDDFDTRLAAELGAIPPPDETVSAVMPWREAVRRIVLGLCLTCFTLEIPWLRELLPAVGTVELLLGFRVLRRNGRWFSFTYAISIGRVGLLFLNAALSATPYRHLWLTGRVALSIGLTLALLLGFRQALRQAAAQAGQSMPRDPLLWAACWYGALVLLALVCPQPGWLVFLGLAALFICILRSLLQVSGQLAEWGYAVHAAPVRVSAGRLRILLLTGLAVMALALSLLSNHIPVKGEPACFSVEETAAARQQLLKLGFPQPLLDQLPPEELATLSAANICRTSQDRGDAASLESVFLRLGKDRLRVYHFFTLEPAEGLPFLQNHLALQTEDAVAVTGGLFWLQKGHAMAASLSLAPRSTVSWFGTPETWQEARFSYPLSAGACGGWIAYTCSADGGVLTAYDFLRITGQSPWTLYPFRLLDSSGGRPLLNTRTRSLPLPVLP